MCMKNCICISQFEDKMHHTSGATSYISNWRITKAIETAYLSLFTNEKRDCCFEPILFHPSATVYIPIQYILELLTTNLLFSTDEISDKFTINLIPNI